MTLSRKISETGGLQMGMTFATKRLGEIQSPGEQLLDKMNWGPGDLDQNAGPTGIKLKNAGVKCMNI